MSNLSVNINHHKLSKDVLFYNNYNPFGLKHKGYNNVITGRDHKYGFGGKEYNDELGFDWYDVSARNYDPALGRWMNLDPLAEQMRRHSPYNFGFDNPIYFQDYDGMAPVGLNDDTARLENDEYYRRMSAKSDEFKFDDFEGYSSKGVSDGTNTSSSNGGDNDCCGGGGGVSLANGKTLVMGVNGVESLKTIENSLAYSGIAIGAAADATYNVVLNSRNSLSILEKVGKSNNLQLLRYSKYVSTWSTRIGNAGALISVPANIMAYENNDIGGVRLSYRLTSALAPIGIAAMTTGPIGAGAAIMLTGGELMYDAAVDLWETIKKNTPPINFSQSGIMQGFTR